MRAQPHTPPRRHKLTSLSLRGMETLAQHAPTLLFPYLDYPGSVYLLPLQLYRLQGAQTCWLVPT